MVRLLKTVLVTGANGFVGQSLSKQLIHLGYEVVCVTRKPYHLSGTKNINIVNLEEADWPKHLNNIDSFIHTAARAHIINETSTDPYAEFHRVNVSGTLNLAKQAAQAGVRRFIFISSIGVNGNQNLKPFTEEDEPNPQEPYALSKFVAEQGLRLLAQKTNMEVVIIRPPLVYAPHAPGNIARLLKMVTLADKYNLPLPFGAINNRRSLVALDNLVNFIVTCLEHPAAANQTFLVADNKSTSTSQLLRYCAAAHGLKLWMLPIPPKWLKLCAALLGKRTEMIKLCDNLEVDTTKAKLLLDWNPPISSVLDGFKANTF